MSDYALPQLFKAPALDMKWENHDIDVVQWVNIRKFPLLLNGD